MKYYLLQNGKEYGPYARQDIVESIKDGGIPLETQIREESQAEWQSVCILLPPKPQPDAPVVEKIRVPAITMALSAKAHLKQVRSQGAYGGLRGFITVLTFVVVIASLVVSIWAAVDQDWIRTAGWAIPVMVFPALRAGVFVFIDIADILLDASRGQ